MELSLLLENDLGAPRHARRAVAGLLARQGAGVEQTQAAEVVVSELVTNAVTHTQTTHIGVAVRIEAGAVRMEVSDGHGDAGALRLRRPAPTELGGRGLPIIDAMASSWGVMRRRDGRPGKTVWATVPL